MRGTVIHRNESESWISFYFTKANLSCKAGIRLMMSTPLLLDAVKHSSPLQAVTRGVMELDSSDEEFCRFTF